VCVPFDCFFFVFDVAPRTHVHAAAGSGDAAAVPIPPIAVGASHLQRAHAARAAEDAAWVASVRALEGRVEAAALAEEAGYTDLLVLDREVFEATLEPLFAAQVAAAMRHAEVIGGLPEFADWSKRYAHACMRAARVRRVRV
jgi:hypothetical protein